MKRPTSSKEHLSSSSDDSTDSEDVDSYKIDGIKQTGGSKKFIDTISEAGMKKKKLSGIDYKALSKHGYHGGPSVLKVPPPKRAEDEEINWSWSTGRDEGKAKNSTEETFAERERTRAAAHGEELLHAQASPHFDRRERKAASLSQKEKRKRDLGQSSRGKNYVEEEKRLLRDSGIYSGFDS